MRPVAAIVQQANRFDLLRCRCPVCLGLDAAHPGEAFQLALFPYRPTGSNRGPLKRRTTT